MKNQTVDIRYLGWHHVWLCFKASENLLMDHYADLKERPFFPTLINYMSSGPVVAMVSTLYTRMENHSSLNWLSSAKSWNPTSSVEFVYGLIRCNFNIFNSTQLKFGPVKSGKDASIHSSSLLDSVSICLQYTSCTLCLNVTVHVTVLQWGHSNKTPFLLHCSLTFLQVFRSVLSGLLKQVFTCVLF